VLNSITPARSEIEQRRITLPYTAMVVKGYSTLLQWSEATGIKTLRARTPKGVSFRVNGAEAGML